jgi:hypothetical protein
MTSMFKSRNALLPERERVDRTFIDGAAILVVQGCRISQREVICFLVVVASREGDQVQLRFVVDYGETFNLCFNARPRTNHDVRV